MPDAIRDATAYTVGFLVDIDIECTSRWSAIRSRLKEIGISSPTECPSTGFFGKLPDYPHRFGVWLMPDCKTDGQKLEDLLATLIPAHDPLWVHAQKSTQDAAEIVDEVNASGAKKWTRFSDTDWIKAVMRAWLAWQREPGVQLGAAINDHILHADSPEAIAFLKWVKALFEFPNLSV
jgi:hypothetical protein